MSHKSKSLEPGSTVIVDCGLISSLQTPEWWFTAWLKFGVRKNCCNIPTRLSSTFTYLLQFCCQVESSAFPSDFMYCGLSEEAWAILLHSFNVRDRRWLVLLFPKAIRQIKLNSTDAESLRRIHCLPHDSNGLCYVSMRSDMTYTSTVIVITIENRTDHTPLTHRHLLRLEPIYLSTWWASHLLHVLVECPHKKAVLFIFVVRCVTSMKIL